VRYPSIKISAVSGTFTDSKTGAATSAAGAWSAPSSAEQQTMAKKQMTRMGEFSLSRETAIVLARTKEDLPA
jgi:hypothetical protein